MNKVLVHELAASAGGVSASLDLVLSDGELELEMDGRIGPSSAVMRAPLRSVGLGSASEKGGGAPPSGGSSE